MSANNYILIEELKDKFLITHRDYDTDALLYGKKEAKTLREAIEKAEELRYEEFPVEYGFEFKLRRPSNKLKENKE